VLTMFMKNIKSDIVACVCVALIMAGCGGRVANPVMAAQYGDNKKSCDALQIAMSQSQQEISRLIPETEKTGTNTALGITGFFLVVPLFFMDFTESERIEVDAHRQRYNHLALLAMDKNCGYDTKPIQSFEKLKEEGKKKEEVKKEEDLFPEA
jgi:hypothetical protein